MSVAEGGIRSSGAKSDVSPIQFSPSDVENLVVIRFEGAASGSPHLPRVSIGHEPPTGERSDGRAAEQRVFPIGEPGKSEIGCVECKKLKDDYRLLEDEHAMVKKSLEQLKMENKAKERECHEACLTLQDLQNELMRKSMHVGSLAFAVEGQVKEKSRWFSALRDLSDKVEIIKIEHSELLEWGLQYRDCIADMESIARSIQSAALDQKLLGRENEELKGKILKEIKVRRELYNKVLEMKGNIRVFCRCRPLNEEETRRGVANVIDFESAKDGEVIMRAPKKTFKFDAVFSPEADQESVFEDTSPLAMSVLDGYNVCIFAYGQTGTGKTFTMEGKENARGVNYRTLEKLFRIIEERRGLYRYEVTVSVLEVYNEQIRDLLVSDAHVGTSASKRLEIRKVCDGEQCIPGLVEASVSNVSEVWEVLRTGGNARAVGSTNVNEHSSRSHCIHSVMVKGENLINGECTRSKLWLIDLAGSERLTKTDAQGERLKEAQCINKSLSALGDVISALATKSPHVPFRNSKLTHLLQDSLGGDSKALMFVQISPSELDAGETLCSLNFASRVRGIELGPAKKQLDTSEMARNKQMLERAKQEIKVRDIHIKRMEETAQSMEQKLKVKEMASRNLQDKIKELESQLLVERKLARQHVDAKIAEQMQRDRNIQQREEEEPVMLRVEENNLGFAEVVKTCSNSSRLSLCPTSRPAGADHLLRNWRRRTLCPLPLAARGEQLPIAGNSPAPEAGEWSHGLLVVGARRSVKRSAVSSILRRSMQKKVQVRPVMQQQGKRGAAAPGGGGGSKLLKARRVPTGKAIGSNDALQLLKQKERRWN